MGKFSAELTGIMDTRELSLAEVIRDTGISRAAFFKYKNGTRLPSEMKTVTKIAEVLHLNYDESRHLVEAYLIDQIGEYKYRGMRAVEKLLTTPIGILHGQKTEIKEAELLREHDTGKTLSGKLPVSMKLLSVISEGIKQGDVTIFETISSSEIFRIISQVKGSYSANEILHIMAMNGSDNASVHDQLYNVERLGSIFKTLCSCEGYRPLYYYASLSSLRTLGILQTNIVLTKDQVLCYSADFSSAASYRDPETIAMYSGIAAGMRRISSPFAEKMNLSDSIKTYAMFNEHEGERYSFMPGLCLTSIIEKTDDLLDKNVRRDLEGIDAFLTEYERYTSGFQAALAQNKGKYHYIVSGPALRHNYESGFLNEFPKEATIPLDKKGVAKLLRRFRRVSASCDFRIIDDESFPAENTIGLEAAPGLAMVSMILPGELAMRVILVREQSTAALIYDYLSMVYESRTIGGEERERWYERLLST